MIIYADTFKRWAKILESYQKKGDPFGESLFFDFENKFIYFGSDFGKGRMKFFFECKEEEKLPYNFFISTSKFLNIITKFDSLELTKDFVFKKGEDKFKFSVVKNEEDRVIKNIFENDFVYEVLNKDIFKKIEDASVFVNKDDADENLHNIFVKNNLICSMSSVLPFYESKINYTGSFAVEVDVAKLITQIGTISEGCKFTQNTKTAIIKSIDDEIEMIIPNCYTTEFPDDLQSDSFIKTYKHPTFVKIDCSLFNHNLSFLKMYLNASNNGKLFFNFTDTDMIMRIEEDDATVEKHMPFIEISSELKNKTFALPGFKIDTALGILKDKELTIRLPVDESLGLVDLLNNEDQHIVISRFKTE